MSFSNESGELIAKGDSFAAGSSGSGLDSLNSNSSGQSPSIQTPPSGRSGGIKPSKLNLARQASSAENLLLPSTPDGGKVGHGHYIPRWVQAHVSALSDRDELDSFKQDLEVAVLCVDIVGFTALTGLLSASSSAEGAEHVSQVLNAYFARVLEIIELFDGDVIQFSGDALMVIFNTQSDVDSNALVCIKCAQAICHTVEAATVEVLGQQVDISLKLGIAAGPVSLVISGGYKGRWISLAGGPAWNNSALACDDCLPCHIIVHSSATRQLKRKNIMDNTCCGGRTTMANKSVLIQPPFAAVTKAPTRLPSPELSDDAKLMLRSFLPRAILKQQRNELRSVVTIFAKFCDLDHPSDENIEKLYTLSSTLQKSCHKFGAFLNKIMFDDKGLLALICFGIPQYVHADDTERGCLLSAEIITNLQGITRVVIGMTRNRVYCGELGSLLRAEYTVLGDSVNLASRLMSFGSKTDEESCIVTDDVVYNEVKDHFPFKSVSHVAVKGKAEEITAAMLDLKVLYTSLAQENLISPRSSASSRFSKSSPLSMRSRQSDSTNSSLKLSRRLRTVGSTNEMWNYGPTPSPDLRSSIRDSRRPSSSVRLRTSRHSIRTNTASGVATRDEGTARQKTIVGRDTEFDQFMSFISDFSLSSGKNKITINNEPVSYFIVEGCKGTGKTAFLRHCAYEVSRQSLTLPVLEGMQKYQYSTATQLLKIVLALHEDGASPVGSAWLREVIGEHEMFELYSGVIDRLLPGIYPKTSNTGRRSIVSSDLVRDLLETVLAEHCNSISEQVMCLFIDDFQFMDPYSMGALLDLMDIVAGKEMALCMCISATSTDNDSHSKGSSAHSADSDEFASVLAKIKAKPHVHIELDGLPRDAAVQHYKQFLQAATIDDSLAEVVFLHSEGIPFMAELILNNLVEQDYLACNAEGEATLLKHDLDLSDLMAGLNSIESEILKRLDTLVAKMGDAVSHFIKTVCVMGTSLDTRVLRSMFRSERAIGSVHAMCTELVKRKILNRRDLSGVVVYTFRSAMFPKVQYNNMLMVERKEAHMKVALAMEELQEEISIDSATVAGHFYHAEMYEEALQWYTQALEVALASDNFMQMRSLLNKAIATATQLSRGGLYKTPLSDQIVPLPGSVADRSPGYVKYSASEQDTELAPIALNGVQVHMWKLLLLDIEVTLGNLKHSKTLVCEWCGVDADALPGLAAIEEKKYSRFFRFCCAPRYTPIAEGATIHEYMTGLDLAVLSNDRNLFLVMSGSLMRDKVPQCKEPTLLLMCHAVGCLRELLLGRPKEAATQWALVNKKPPVITLPMLMCFTSYQAMPYIEETFTEDNISVLGYSAASSSRVNLMGLLVRVLKGHLEGDPGGVVGVLDAALHNSRKVRNKPLFLKCVLMGRALKLSYELDDSAPRSITNSDDLLFMVMEEEWASSADDTVLCMAYIVSAAEPLMGSPLMRRRSRSGKGQVDDRDTKTLIQQALKHLATCDEGSLHPILIPCIHLLIDVIMWSVRDGVLPVEQAVPFLQQMHASIDALCLIFKEWGYGLKTVCRVAAAFLDKSLAVPQKEYKGMLKGTEKKLALAYQRLHQWSADDDRHEQAAKIAKEYKLKIPVPNALRISLSGADE